MIDQIRFHLDESVNPAIAEGLRRHGFDVSTSQEVGLLRASDERQLDYAGTEQRVLVSFDHDFLILASSGYPHAGIAYCHPERGAIGSVIFGLQLIHDCMTNEQMQNHVEFL